MIILGLNSFHGDSSAAIVHDGTLAAAAEEERFASSTGRGFRRRRSHTAWRRPGSRSCSTLSLWHIDAVGGASTPSALTEQASEAVTVAQCWALYFKKGCH